MHADGPAPLCRRRMLLGWGMALAACGGPLAARAHVHDTPDLHARPLSFGLLPSGGAVETRRDWQPVLEDMGRAIGRAVGAISLSSYESLERAIARGQVDIAFLSGKLALDAVRNEFMRVIAQVGPQRGAGPEHCAVLLARRNPPLNSLGALLAAPQRWRIARGDSRSISGYMVPQTQLFLPNGIEIETRFASELIGTHQESALAVANGDADVATSNIVELARFRQQFPVEAERLHVIWQSAPIPPAQILVRADWPHPLQRRVQAFLAGYGQTPGPRGEAQRNVLKTLQAMEGYRVADNSALLPVARLEYELARQRALAGQWVSEAARSARLARLEAEYVRQSAWLRRDTVVATQ